MAIVFQSAPLTEARGDLPEAVYYGRFHLFQSAPLTEARGDDYVWSAAAGTISFNPLPSPKQGETHRRRGGILDVEGVSIRSPHRSKGRLGGRECFNRTGNGRRFQSAPLTEARGDALAHQLGCPDLAVSIRSPHRSKGRRYRSTRCRPTARVSIRSPHRSKGRRWSL